MTWETCFVFQFGLDDWWTTETLNFTLAENVLSQVVKGKKNTAKKI